MAIVYKISNSITPYIYIGSTTTTLAKRWYAHKFYAKKETQSPLCIAMISFGIKNFKIEIIEECEKERVKEREMFWAKHYNSFYPNGYNTYRPTAKNEKKADIYPTLAMRVTNYEFKIFKTLQEHGYSAKDVILIAISNGLPAEVLSKTTGQLIKIPDNFLAQKKKY